METAAAEWQRYRIWIASYDDWHPADWHDVPPRAIALEPADLVALSAHQARSFLEGFNREMLQRQRRRQQQRLWAVAVPVIVRFEGDPQPGEAVSGHRL
ncbi:MAG TPA: hypothetical protein VMF30_01995 [Pirellulales bacterium]|nr:hypothetical protein [Pirellulales bacterium]